MDMRIIVSASQKSSNAECGKQYRLIGSFAQHTLSVFEKSQSIDKAKDLWDSRLGVYNLLGKDNRCCTCGAKKPSDCDGMHRCLSTPSKRELNKVLEECKVDIVKAELYYS